MIHFLNSPPELLLIPKKQFMGHTTMLFVHEETDLEDAFDLQPTIHIELTKNSHEIILTKKMLERESTAHTPCGRFGMLSCIGREFVHLANEKNCSASFIYDNGAVDDLLIGRNFSHCSPDQIVAIADQWIASFDNLWNTKCLSKVPCKFTQYDYLDSKLKNDKNRSEYMLKLKPMVEHSKFYISYDFQSLVSEVGGALGLTIGLSFLSLFEKFNNIIDIIVQKVKSY